MKRPLTSYTREYLTGSDTHLSTTQYYTRRTPTLEELDSSHSEFDED